jgi:hypothetical protein
MNLIIFYIYDYRTYVRIVNSTVASLTKTNATITPSDELLGSMMTFWALDSFVRYQRLHNATCAPI